MHFILKKSYIKKFKTKFSGAHHAHGVSNIRWEFAHAKARKLKGRWRYRETLVVDAGTQV